MFFFTYFDNTFDSWDLQVADLYFSFLDLSFVENCHWCIFMTYLTTWIYRLSNLIHRNCAAKVQRICALIDVVLLYQEYISMFVSKLIEKYRWNSGIAVEESISQAAGLPYRGGLRFFVC